MWCLRRRVPTGSTTRSMPPAAASSRCRARCGGRFPPQWTHCSTIGGLWHDRRRTSSRGGGVMTAAATHGDQIARYLDGVRTALSDLPDDARDELLDDLPDHLAEVLAED